MAGTKKFEIHVKGGFSERRGIKNFSDVVQLDSLNRRTRNKLYAVTEGLLERYENKIQLIEYIYTEIFSLTSKEIPISNKEFVVFGNYYDKVEEELLEKFRTIDFNEIFDFIEGIIKGIRLKRFKGVYVENINNVFIEENVNYRIVNDIIVDFTSEEEISEIDEAIKNPYAKVSEHLQKALEKLYHDKDNSNSIKESISAVESMCQVMLNNDKVTLGQALKALKVKIHPALNAAFDKLYGYTSDANGIRHANGLGEGESTFSEAKFMLVSCSAFVNYLKENFENK